MNRLERAMLENPNLAAQGRKNIRNPLAEKRILDVGKFILGETPSEMALNAALGMGRLPFKLGAGALSLMTASDDAEAGPVSKITQQLMKVIKSGKATDLNSGPMSIKEPEKAAGLMRLYRGGTPNGSWWSADRSVAEDFMFDRGGRAGLHYIDVPEKDWARWSEMAKKSGKDIPHEMASYIPKNELPSTINQIAQYDGRNGRLFTIGGNEDAVNVKPNGWVRKKIPLDMIEHGESAMPGGKLTWPDAAERISDYASRKTELPPIELMAPDEAGGLYMISDGSHRFEAARRRGQKTIDAYLSPEDVRVLSKAGIVGAGGLGLMAGYDDAEAGVINKLAKSMMTVGGKKFDPRFDKRVKEADRLNSLAAHVDQVEGVNIPKVSLADFEGRPFVTSMSDRTAAGESLIGINDVKFNRPVQLQGGQEYAFHNPGQAWASGRNPANQIMNVAQAVRGVTGQNPIHLPWRMAPTGGDFAHMTGETMLAYADAAMGKGARRSLDREMKKLVPDWAGLGSERSIEQFRELPDKTRKMIKKVLDTKFRDSGGIGIGEARLAVADPKQLGGKDGGIQAVNEIFADKPMIKGSGHVSYPYGVPGRGLGLAAEGRNIFELLPDVARARGLADPTNPRPADIRALQMKPYAGIINAELLKQLGY